MTTIERYPSTSLEDHHLSRPTSSDEPFNRQPSHSKTSTITKSIPPAVPSPPPLSSRRSPLPDRHLCASPSPQRIMASPGADIPNQWCFTDAEVNSTPSVLDGLPIAEERSRRAKGVNFISQAGILLKLPQLTLATASVFFHRFYMRYSMVPEKGGLHHYNIAATSLFLATKTEENCRKTKEIVIAVAKVAQKNASLVIDEQSKEYWRWRDNILLYEELMLELLTFDVVLESPYNHLYHVLGSLELDTNKPLRNAAWGWINDSCLTMMCLLIPPRDIAIAAVYFAAKYTRGRISDDEQGGPWWEREGGREDRIRKAVAVMHEFYSENPLKKTQEQSPFFKGERGEEDLSSTRRQAGSDPKDESPNSGSQNGHSQTEQPTPNGKVEQLSPSSTRAKDEQHSSSQSDAAKSAALAGVGMDDTPASLGDSDRKLKAAANDPATHQANGHTNGVADLQPPNGKTSPKRKAENTFPESDAKRLKTEDAEEGEEGELEE